jgi:hypothetical protein
MNRTRTSVLLSVLTTAMLTVGAPPALADDEGRAVRTRPRPLDLDAQRATRVKRPAADGVPEDLRLAPPPEQEVVRSARGPASSTRPSGVIVVDRPAPDVAVLSRQAAAAARWSAAAVVDRGGALNYYRAGWYRGLRRALEHPALGEWDYLAGVRFGSRDPDARRLGLDEGARAAAEDAYGAAEARVEGQFLDLSRPPVPDRDAEVGAWSRTGHWADPPELRDVFAAHPVARLTFASDRARRAFRDWTYDPWTLSRCESHGEFLDTRWSDPDRAFDLWTSNRRRAAYWFALDDPTSRRAFRHAFEHAFRRALANEHARALERAWREGHDDGWDYGTVVVFEWNWRRGWAEGFDRAVTRAAEDAYLRSYGPEYRAAYDAAFDRWSHSAVPGIESVTLVDGNDDGVFEPGEDVLVEVRAVNYGGGSGTVALEVAGRHLLRGDAAEIRLDGRGPLDRAPVLRATIATRAAVRTRTAVDVTLGDATAEAAFRVGRPLEIADGIGFDADVLGGRATLELEVVNRSRRPVAGAVRVERRDGRGARDEAVPTLAPGASRTVAFDLEAIRPAALVGGSFESRLVVESAGVVQDELDWRAPDRASDLGSRVFADWIAALAADPGTTSAELDEARALMLRRLEADWARAVRGRGNPYKEDLKKGRSGTAVGELVRLRESAGKRGDHAGVYRMLAREIDAHADALPGTHPFLRKALRKLADRLG